MDGTDWPRSVLRSTWILPRLLTIGLAILLPLTKTFTCLAAQDEDVLDLDLQLALAAAGLVDGLAGGVGEGDAAVKRDRARGGGRASAGEGRRRERDERDTGDQCRDEGGATHGVPPFRGVGRVPAPCPHPGPGRNDETLVLGPWRFRISPGMLDTCNDRQRAVVSDNRGEILRPVAVFAMSGLVVLILVAIAGAFALRQPQHLRGGARRPPPDDHHRPRHRRAGLTTGVVRGDQAALAKLDRIIRRRVLAADVARVKIWNAGRILYSDEPQLIGRSLHAGLRRAQRSPRQVGVPRRAWTHPARRTSTSETWDT